MSKFFRAYAHYSQSERVVSSRSSLWLWGMIGIIGSGAGSSSYFLRSLLLLRLLDGSRSLTLK